MSKLKQEAESASRILPESNPVRESAMTMQPECDRAELKENYVPKNGHATLRTPPCGDHVETSTKPTSAQAKPQLKRKAGSPIDSAVIRKVKQMINRVDKEQQ
ncbi:hypothetical protein HS088_TW02G00462 [Tripterygium wilfordii]|uniref:Uncharacterized protein n=1 Tax=Tripterygium wilfordii TaxID=458696 RepID=A0A7J7DYJ7_TRIWF|nr:hypothetical protein HS088_TW02G00462 [Tripterygium wilfordii]